MNLAVHGMSGNIRQAISYYDYAQQELKVGQADFVMANPPFNVDEIDAPKIENDPRLVFGLPGTNKDKKVPNGNYIWVSYFYSYLNDTGRAGFVMSSQTSSAGRDEAKVREQLVKTGHVDVMMAISGGFFYTRTVPCELWFFDKGKPEDRQDFVLMIDARHTRRKVTRTVYDFSPEQLSNLCSIVWLYRKQETRFLELLQNHLTRTQTEIAALEPFLVNFIVMQTALLQSIKTFWDASLFAVQTMPQNLTDLEAAFEAFKTTIQTQQDQYKPLQLEPSNAALHAASAELLPTMQRLTDLSQQADALQKLTQAVLDDLEALKAKDNQAWKSTEIRKQKNALEAARSELKAQLEQAQYFFKHAKWLQDRFPDAELRDVPGLVKLVSKSEIAAADYSLTPGRYVGVAPEEEEEGFDFANEMKTIHAELQTLNEEAQVLAAKIQSNLEGFKL
jgi:type I restriction enzyme M protein